MNATFLRDFARDIIAAEREACAKIAEEYVAHGLIGKGQDNAAKDIAAAIRARTLSAGKSQS